MKKHCKPACLAISLLLFIGSKAQYYYYNNRYYDQATLFETGIGIGAMNAFTDLGGHPGEGKPLLKDLNFCNTLPAFGIYAGLNYKRMLGLKLQFTCGKIKAFDSILRKANNPITGRYERNLSFQSPIQELGLELEFYPFSLTGNQDKAAFCSPYILVGAAAFHFNPQARLEGKWHRLQPLHTEGQGFEEYPDRKIYSLLQMNWLMGAGVRTELNSLVVLRFETTYRLLGTDYLDDVSSQYIEPKLFYHYLNSDDAAVAYKLSDRRGELDPTHEPHAGDMRGNPGHNDGYFTVELKLGIVLGRERIKN